MPARRSTVLVAASSVLALAACSSGSATKADSVAATPASASASVQAAAATSDTLIAKLKSALPGISAAHLALTVTAGGQKFSASGAGTMKAGVPTALKLDATVAGFDVATVVVGKAIYVKLPASINNNTKLWLKASPTSTNPIISQLSTTLQSLQDSASLDKVLNMAQAASQVSNLGSAQLNGATVTHYRLTVDVAKLPATGLFGSAPQLGLTTVPVDLYLDSQNRPVRVSENVTAKAQQVAAQVDVSQYNVPVTITAPPASQTHS